MNKKQELASIPVKTLVQQDSIMKKFDEVLGKRAPQFVSSLVSVVNSNQDLAKVDQTSVIASALVAASLDLPINPSFGYMWLVPYKGKAQPQLGYKGYIQLAQRSGQYKHLNAIAVYKDEFEGWNPLTEELLYKPNFRDREDNEVPVGYVGYFSLSNGFEKTVFWTWKQIDDHRQKFSKMSGKTKPTGVWATNYNAMALKTVLRNLIGKWGPMTVDMQNAYTSDESEVDVGSLKDVTDANEQSSEPATDVKDLINDYNSSEDSKQASKPTEKKETKGVEDNAATKDDGTKQQELLH